MPRGHVLLGYDDQGRCPMLVDNRCSVYEHRPRTCRTYDCRIFPAAGLHLDGADKAQIGRRARRWQFDHPSVTDQVEHDAVRAAAAYLEGHGELLEDPSATGDVARLAVLAVEVHGAFVDHDQETGDAAVITPDSEVVRLALIGNRLVGA
jgi:hypothetical protein